MPFSLFTAQAYSGFRRACKKYKVYIYRFEHVPVKLKRRVSSTVNACQMLHAFVDGEKYGLPARQHMRKKHRVARRPSQETCRIGRGNQAVRYYYNGPVLNVGRISSR